MEELHHVERMSSQEEIDITKTEIEKNKAEVERLELVR
jgi:hypothetical protein